MAGLSGNKGLLGIRPIRSSPLQKLSTNVKSKLPPLAKISAKSQFLLFQDLENDPCVCALPLPSSEHEATTFPPPLSYFGQLHALAKHETIIEDFHEKGCIFFPQASGTNRRNRPHNGLINALAHQQGFEISKTVYFWQNTLEPPALFPLLSHYLSLSFPPSRKKGNINTPAVIYRGCSSIALAAGKTP